MGDLRGREALKEAVAQWLTAVPDARCTVESVISHGDLAAWLVRTTGMHTGDALGFPATNKRYETVHPEFGRFRDGKAAEHWAEQGMMSMLSQLGLMSPPGG